MSESRATTKSRAVDDQPIVTVLIGTVPVVRLAMPLARRFNQVCLAAMAELLRADDLVPLQYAVLGHLYHQPNIDQRGLASRMAVDRTNAGLLVDQLAHLGLVERRIDLDDRRVRLLRLTAKGVLVFNRYAPRMLALNRKILEAALSTAEAEKFMDMFVRIIQANETLARPGLGRRRRKSRSSAAESKLGRNYDDGSRQHA
jgi:DNA-binding MarR family transcriptional regulator